MSWGVWCGIRKIDRGSPGCERLEGRDIESCVDCVTI